MARASHGSPWTYDRHVPIFVMGPGISTALVEELVSPESIARTLAARLGITAPAEAHPSTLPGVAGASECGAR